ncbi:MAG TPA: cytochrome C [Planctomycetaceae bacterium]|nr:cytochrome C [Planctomycetaceae bacterium]
MSQVFHPAANALARGTIFGGIFLIAAVAAGARLYHDSPYMTQQDVVRDQPVPFSHDHHVSGLGIDCRFCHATVEKTASAGLPTTETCMGCHALIWNRSPLLAPVRESFRTGEPLAWTRVYDVPDFVYFNHSIHVAKGIGCESCHGRIDQMPLTRKAVTLHMQWCLDCHREPESAVRPRENVFRFGVEKQPSTGSAPQHAFEATKPAGGTTETLTKADHTRHATPSGSDPHELVRQYGIKTHQLSDCVVCHR